MLRSLAISSQVCAKGKRDISRGDYVRKADQYRIVDLGGGGAAGADVRCGWLLRIEVAWLFCWVPVGSVSFLSGKIDVIG